MFLLRNAQTGEFLKTSQVYEVGNRFRKLLEMKPKWDRVVKRATVEAMEDLQEKMEYAYLFAGQTPPLTDVVQYISI